MKFKVAFIFLLTGLFAMSSCEQNVNDELERYLSSMRYQTAYDSVASGVMENSFIEFDNQQDRNEVGKTTQIVSFCRYTKNDVEYYYVKSENNFYGNRVNEDRLSYDIITSYNAQKESYETLIYENDELIKETQISDEDGFIAYRDIFYTSFEAYYSGGIYYGDEAMARVRQFEGYFKFNEDNSLTLYGQAKYEGVQYIQYITINELGLLINRSDYMEIISTKTYAEQFMDVKYNEFNLSL